MEKLNINDFPSLDGVSLVPTKTLKYIIDIYNSEIDKDICQFGSTIDRNVQLIKEGKRKAYSEEEFIEILEKEGL